MLQDVYAIEKKLGGALFNVTAHLAQLGTRVNIITKVDPDFLGNDMIKAIKSQNISMEQLHIDENLPTGTVEVSLGVNGISNYKIDEPVAQDFIKTSLVNLELVKNADALVYGSLACQSSSNFNTLIELLK